MVKEANMGTTRQAKSIPKRMGAPRLGSVREHNDTTTLCNKYVTCPVPVD
jgi:hypothetical protein